MAHATGIVFQADDNHVIAYFDYDGTADICLPQLYTTYTELLEHWRRGSFPRCSSPSTHPKVSVKLYSDYGQGSWWPGTICPKCRLISSDMTKDYDHEKDGWRPDGKPTGYDRIMHDAPYSGELYPDGDLS